MWLILIFTYIMIAWVLAVVMLRRIDRTADAREIVVPPEDPKKGGAGPGR